MTVVSILLFVLSTTAAAQAQATSELTAAVACVVGAWNAYDAGAARRCYDDSPVAVWNGERRPIDWAFEERLRAFDAAARSRFRFEIVRAQPPDVEFTLFETNELLDALGLARVTARWRYAVRGGRVMEEQLLEGDGAFGAALQAFTRWGREQRPAGWESITDGDGNVRFDGTTAATLIALTRQWTSRSFPVPRNGQESVPGIRATRVTQNPLITVDSSPSLGGNVNGPTVIRVPDWVQLPLGRYYMYFANHMGAFIRLAYADAVTGPWRIHEPGVLHVRDTAFFRPQPDPKETLADFYTHVASPEVFVDHARRRFVMWVHGWWTNGERWPRDPPAARSWARQMGYGQFTQAAESADGLRFTVSPAITRNSYMRVFEHRGYFYGVSRLGQLARARDATSSFEIGPNPFRDTAYAGRIRHVALVHRGDRLHVFFTAIGDAPERVLVSTIDVTSDWTTWRATTPVEVLRPETPYECTDMAVTPSEPGDIDTPARQIRDPFVFQDQGKAFLFYATCGEQGIAAAELTIP